MIIFYCKKEVALQPLTVGQKGVSLGLFGVELNRLPKGDFSVRIPPEFELHFALKEPKVAALWKVGDGFV